MSPKCRLCVDYGVRPQHHKLTLIVRLQGRRPVAKMCGVLDHSCSLYVGLGSGCPLAIVPGAANHGGEQQIVALLIQHSVT